jgi:prepilin-type processing-associated H-X9-DG protein
MNNWMGSYEPNGTAVPWTGCEAYRVFKKTSDIVAPQPVDAWVFIDEREDSINDGFFVVNTALQGRSAKIVDYPASYHNGSGGLAFADGHAEIHKWLDPRTTPTMSSADRPLDQTSPNNQDIAWLQPRSSSLK